MFYLVIPRYRLRISVFAIPVLLILLSLEGGLPFFILMLSAILHEFGHLLALKVCGFRPRRIDILPMGALIVCPEGLADREEIKVALAGPVFSLFGAVISAVIFAVTSNIYVFFAFFINSALLIFNLIPNKKLDGGKALLCFLRLKKEKDTAERICSAVSALVTILFAVTALICWYISDFNTGVLLLLTSLMLQLI